MSTHQTGTDGAAPGPDGVRLMIPGPCELGAAQLAVLGAQTVPHYGDAWAPFLLGVLGRLERVLGAHAAYLIPGSGSAGLEMALLNTFARGERVVVPNTGYFAVRFAETAAALGLRTELTDPVLDRPVHPDDVANALDDADGLLVVHVDSTTGIRQPLAELAATARSRGAVTVVDAIASAGGEPIDVNDDGIDVLVTASQKGLGGPPGLAVLAFDDVGLRRALSRRPASWYFDLRRWDDARQGDPHEPHPVTMPTAAVRALNVELTEALNEGVGARLARRGALAARLRAGLRSLGVAVHAPDEHAATLVTAARFGDVDGVTTALRAAGIMIGRGLPPLDDLGRVGLLGATGTVDHVDRLLGVLATIPDQARIPHRQETS